jgi:hypothetical protein
VAGDAKKDRQDFILTKHLKAEDNKLSLIVIDCGVWNLKFEIWNPKKFIFAPLC